MDLTNAPRNQNGRLYVPELDDMDRLIAASMADVGAAPARAEPTPVAVRPELPPETRRQLTGALLIIGAMALLALYAFWPRAAERPTTPGPAGATDDRRPTTDHRPAVAPAPTRAPSATPEPPTAMPEPPTQTPVVVYVEQPPCYSVTQDVYSADARAVIGQVTGQSCESQAAAQAAADDLAAQMKGATP